MERREVKSVGAQGTGFFCFPCHFGPFWAVLYLAAGGRSRSPGSPWTHCQIRRWPVPAQNGPAPGHLNRRRERRRNGRRPGAASRGRGDSIHRNYGGSGSSTMTRGWAGPGNVPCRQLRGRETATRRSAPTVVPSNDPNLNKLWPRAIPV